MVGVWDEKCIPVSFGGNTVGEDSALTTRSHSGPGTISRSTCPSVSDDWETWAYVWHHCILYKIFVSCNRREWKGASPCYLIKRGIECSSLGTSTHAKCGRHPEAFKGSFFQGLWKLLWDLKQYLYDDLRIMYPELMTAAHKVESENKDRPEKGTQVRFTQAEGGD